LAKNRPIWSPCAHCFHFFLLTSTCQIIAFIGTNHIYFWSKIHKENSGSMFTLKVKWDGWQASGKACRPGTQWSIKSV
jgi:hypothetical protein